MTSEPTSISKEGNILLTVCIMVWSGSGVILKQEPLFWAMRHLSPLFAQVFYKAVSSPLKASRGR
jgi:hypothetical protein